MYTWIEPKEVATNEAPVEYVEGSNRRTKSFSRDGSRSRKKNRDKFTPYNKDNGILGSLFKSLREILATKKVTKAFNPHTRMTGRRKNRDTTKYCHFYKDHGHNTNYRRELKSQIEEAVKSRQLAHLVKGNKKGKKALDTQMSE
nr:retrotransposon Gag domain-containing protein [Tanacetum cinerariifolium]